MKNLTPPCLAQAPGVANPLEARVSFGRQIKSPALLESRSVRSLLDGVLSGEWRQPVQSVRDFPSNSSVQRAAKVASPYMLWSGEFSRRDTRHLLKHSGIVGIDLDSLSEPEIRHAEHCALDDPHCLAAYRSVGMHGFRLLIRIPFTDAEGHKIAFRAAADHVRSHYSLEPDICGSDVSRASFVSWDGRLIINVNATVLPADTMVFSNHCVRARLATAYYWQCLARECKPYEQRDDGTWLTHCTLRRLGWRIALQARREGLRLRKELIDAVLDVWFGEVKASGIRLRCEATEYRREFWDIVSGAQRCVWLDLTAENWIQWTREAGYPQEPKDRILYAIRRHCELKGQEEFFLSCRDAATVASVGRVKASRLLLELASEGAICRVEKPRAARHAIVYKLLATPENVSNGGHCENRKTKKSLWA